MQQRDLLVTGRFNNIDRVAYLFQIRHSRRHRHEDRGPQAAKALLTILQLARGHEANARRKLRSAELDLQEAQNRSSTLRRQLEGEEPTMGVMSDDQFLVAPMSSQYDGRIAKLEDQLDQLKMQFTDKHRESHDWMVLEMETMHWN